FVLGAAEENPTTFTVRDWHPETGRVIWKKEHLAEDDRFINGFWAVNVRAAGNYRITLRRFPEDDPKAIGATSARIRIGEREETISLDPEDVTAEFELKLPAGPALLHSWLTDGETGMERGAYFVEVLRLVE
ncbi:MAG: N-acetylgalactosamine-6-sulfatase, partial [Verrucomicrobiota bacterium]